VAAIRGTGQVWESPRLVDMSLDFWKDGNEPGGVRGDPWAGEAPGLSAGYQAAAVCRRGHVIEFALTREPGDLGFCSGCGAKILTRCTSCGKRIRGRYFVSLGAQRYYEPPPFCDCCGEPHPWVSREERIYQLENILDEEDIEESDRLLVMQSLERLRTNPELDEKDQAKTWGSIKSRAPGLLAGAAGRMAESIMTAYVKAQMGI
jgi:hypothetical protein